MWGPMGDRDREPAPDPDAPPSPDEVSAAEQLRAHLEGGEADTADLGGLVDALRAAHGPTALSREEALALAEIADAAVASEAEQAAAAALREGLASRSAGDSARQRRDDDAALLTVAEALRAA